VEKVAQISEKENIFQNFVYGGVAIVVTVADVNTAL